VRPIQEGSPGKLMQVALLFRKLDDKGIEKVRRFCNNLPFTWFEGGTEDRTYLALADIPMEVFHETMQRIELYLAGIGDGYELMLLDPSYSKSLSVPDEMFDVDRGWRLFNLPNGTADRMGESSG